MIEEDFTKALMRTVWQMDGENYNCDRDPNPDGLVTIELYNVCYSDFARRLMKELGITRHAN